MTNADQLIRDLHRAFDYTTDNNRDLLDDTTFPMAEVTEELKVEHAYRFLCAYIIRNADDINLNLGD